MPSKVNKICNKIVKNFILLLSVPSFFSFAPHIFTLELYVCSVERTQNAAWDIVAFSSTSETVLFLLSRCHRGADGLINRSLDVWQRFVFWFCCHAVVTRATCMFPVCYNGSVTTWQRDGTKTKQRRRMNPLRFSFPYHQLRYNKGVGWQNKAISWQPYSVLKRNKAMDDEIKDMFFSLFSGEDNQKCKKRKITQIFPYICSARGAVNLQRPSLAQLPASSLGFLLWATFGGVSLCALLFSALEKREFYS